MVNNTQECSGNDDEKNSTGTESNSADALRISATVDKCNAESEVVLVTKYHRGVIKELNSIMVKLYNEMENLKAFF